MVVDSMGTGRTRRLGEVDVAPDGNYTFTYDADKVRPSAGASLDLRVSLTTPEGPGPLGQVLAGGDIRYEAGPEEVVDLELPAAPVSGDEGAVGRTRQGPGGRR